MRTTHMIVACSAAVALAGCSAGTPAPVTATQQPSIATQTPIPPTDTPPPTAPPTPTDLPPTATPMPSATPPVQLELMPEGKALTIEHPGDPGQSNWGTVGSVDFDQPGSLGGVVFEVVEATGPWGPSGAASQGSAPVLKGGSAQSLPAGRYCVADYFGGLSPAEACRYAAPEATQLAWIRPYFAGEHPRVTLSLSVGGCDPKSCTAKLDVQGIQLIVYRPWDG